MWTPAALWSPVEVRAEVPAPPDDVFAVLAEPRTYPDWLVGAQRIRRVDPDFPAPGASFDHSVGATEGATVDDSTEVTEAEPPYHLTLAVHAGVLHGTAEFVVLPIPGGSEVTVRERLTGVGAILTPLTRPVLAGRNAASLRKLADVVARIGPDLSS